MKKELHFTKQTRQKQAAFTMLELVMAIIVLGVLSALAIPRIERDVKQEAADSILADIRYTQLLALADNKQRQDNSHWQRAFWRIGFGNCLAGGYAGTCEYIGSDADLQGAIDNNESATDPSTGLKMTQGGAISTTSKRVFLTKNFGITAVNFGGSCNGAQYIGFDYLGRLHQGYTGSNVPNYGSYLNAPCTISFTRADGDNFSITIQPETGYAQIVGQPDS